MNRRAAILGLAAVAAGAAGLRAALTRRGNDDDDEDQRTASIDVWSLSFETLEGAPLAMADWRGKPLLLNFWATWCGPCVVEMPLLDRFAREQASRRWQVLALAIDQRDPVHRFLADRTLSLPVALAGGPGLELSRQLGNRHGGLPFTAGFDSSGAKVRQHLGPMDAKLLADWVESIR